MSPHVHQQTALQLEHFCTVFAHVARVPVRGGEVLAQLLVGVGSGGRALVLAVELGHLQIETTYFFKKYIFSTENIFSKRKQFLNHEMKIIFYEKIYLHSLPLLLGRRGGAVSA